LCRSLLVRPEEGGSTLLKNYGKFILVTRRDVPEKSIFL
jgi:hypothetical protein